MNGRRAPRDSWASLGEAPLSSGWGGRKSPAAAAYERWNAEA
ncbi:hypothetical protein RA11412_1486 [Rothia aeria]|uniref:Uncharacterized protein n=1 Tax=Rothia aeria TaxID=172042 RepID=A0A2Z5QZ71_9MICC|nr:hypothetical protein RA11412_1486 [Rothia aeria]